MSPRTRKTATTRSPRTRKTAIRVEEIDDPVFANLYGGCFVANVGDWTSEKRSTYERAEAEGEQHLATLEPQDDGDDGDGTADDEQ